MNYIDALNWRYAAKKMNGNRIHPDKLERIIKAVQLAPSSYGLQPYHLLVIDQPDILDRLQKEAAQQPQITQCSHLLVFAVWETVEESHVDEFIQLTAEERSIGISSLSDFANVIKGTVNGLPSIIDKQHWAARQAYIALGMALTAAALEKVDATPMEGFDPTNLDEILGLNKRGLRSVVIATLGYRDAENDWLASASKVRWPASQLVTRISRD